MTDPDKTSAGKADSPACDATRALDAGETMAEELVRVLDGYMADLQAGKPADRDKLLADNPSIARRLEQCLPGIEFIHQAAGPGLEAPRRLGDFQILHEVGRGGMGVVYEARQLSLNRRVALKVLRFGAVADQEAMERFRREAEMVAQLHHTNIVPIFAIGEQHGVWYYAMQFIEGRSLAAVLAETRDAPAAMPAAEVAQWGLQAAEALAHAHQNGVIHRDIKPSNLILDEKGRIWLTDFGLAKRMDDVTLSVTGAMVGTPRYMSPEQASAAKLPVDQRTDIYSLGATLYELATGKPLFEAATAHEVISQILTVEPACPRSVRADLPKDLETIIIKCLSKESHHRYPTAQLLADDLRAFVEGRAIKARRARLPERTARWAKKQKRSMVLAAISAVAAVVLVGGGILAWYRYDQSNRANVGFTTQGPVLQASVVDARGEVVAGTRIPHAGSISLPAGDYRLQVSSPGYLMQTYDFRGESRRDFSNPVELDRPLWPPVPAQREGCDVVDLAGRADVIVDTDNGNGHRLLNGATGKVIWEADFLDEKSQPALVNLPNHPAYSSSRQLCSPVDLDGDGTRDLIWTTRQLTTSGNVGVFPAAVLAVSGKDGKIMWTAPFRPFLPEEPQTKPAAASAGLVNLQSTWAGSPAVADINGDGTPDLIVPYRTELNIHPQSGQVRFLGQEWAEAISGRTGKVIWRHLLHEWTPKGPDYGGQASQSPPPSAEPGRASGVPVVFCQAGPLVVALELATGKQVWQTKDLGTSLARPPQVADLDADGQDDVLAVVEQSDGKLVLLAVSGKTCQPIWAKTLCEDWTGGKKLLVRDWKPSLEPRMPWPLVADLDGDGRCEVIVGVTPAMGRRGGRRSYAPWDRWRSGVEVLDGRTGQTRWRHDLGVRSGDYLGIQHFIVGPDLNGDGHKEVFVAAPPLQRGIHVDALSGKDGRTLWWQVLSDRYEDRVGPLQWFQAGPDGWPRLLARSEQGAYLLSAATGRLGAELVGQWWHNQSLDRCLQTGDLDGDGLMDLCGRFPESDEQRESNRVHALRGHAPEVWRRLGVWSPVQDLDGDGIADLIRPENRSGPREDDQDNPEQVTAVSGRDGRILWQGDTGRGQVRFSGGGSGGGGGNAGANPLDQSLGDLLAGPVNVKAFPLPQGDLDGDGTADLLAFAGEFRWATEYVKDGGVSLQNYSYGWTPKGPLVAISGKTGRRLWTSDEKQLCPPSECPSSDRGGSNCLIVWPQLLACHDLDGDGRPEVILPYNLTGRFVLAVLSGRDGRVIWRQPVGGSLETQPGQATEMLNAIRISAGGGDPLGGPKDLNGDGVPDIVAAVEVKESGGEPWHVLAFSGRDGKVLWRQSLSAGAVQTPAVGDLDGDGKPEVILNRYVSRPPFEPAISGRSRGEVLVLDGRTGQTRWTWPWPGDPCFHASPPIVSDLDGDRRAEVLIGLSKGFCTNPTGKGEIVLLDAGGQVRQRAEVEQAWHGAPCFRTCDLDGDGKWELLFFAAGKLRVTRGGVEQVLWERPSELHSGQVEVLPAAGGRAATVLSWEKDNIFALDGPTGRPLWRAAAGDMKAVLPSSDPKELPRLLYRPQRQDATLCRLALPTDAAGRYSPPTPAPIIFGPPPPDPRLAYGLPWAPAYETFCIPPDAYEFFAVSIPTFLLGLVVPWLLVRSAVRRRSRRRGIVAGIYIAAVIAGIGVFANLKMLEQETHPHRPSDYVWLFMLVTAGGVLVSGGPCVALLGSFTCGLAKRRWRRLGLLLGASFVLAVAIAVALLLFDPRRLGPNEYYRWTGWYWAWFLGAYVTGAGLLVIYVFRAAVRLVLRLFRRGKAPAMPA